MPPVRVEPATNSPGYRIRTGNYIAAVAYPYVAGTLEGDVEVIYDTGEEDVLHIGPVTTTAGTAALAISDHGAHANGYVVDGFTFLSGTNTTTGYVQLLITADVNASRTLAILGCGFVGSFRSVNVGTFVDFDLSQGGATWVFQGTVAEDATAGTHVCTLTVTPGAGNEIELTSWTVTVGNTATAQAFTLVITDGTNTIVNATDSNAGTTASLRRVGYGLTFAVQSGTATGGPPAQQRYTISGPMQLILQVSTAAVSVTQTFAVVCRVKKIPTATLADTVGAPVLTTNTSGVFG